MFRAADSDRNSSVHRQSNSERSLIKVVMSEKSEVAKRYRDLAIENRKVASGTKSHKDRDSLVKLAEEYERMARELEAEDATEQILKKVQDHPRVAHCPN